MMPNFLIIGANKGGTTSLYEYLKQHPEIYMSPVKEPMFFTKEGQSLDAKELGLDRVLKQAVNNLKNYQALFKNVTTEKAIGETSTTYLHNPWCATRIKDYIPDVKLIAILRNGIERAYSNYLMYVSWGLETLSFEQAVEEEDNRIRKGYPQGWHYVNLGFYYEPLKHFLTVFPEDQIKIYLYEDLKKNSLGVVQNIFEFLEVDSSYVPHLSILHNQSLIPKNKHLHSFLNKPNITRKLLHRLLPKATYYRLLKKLRRDNMIKPSMKLEVRQKLINIYREDTLKLQDLLQRDLSSWLI